MNRAFFKSGVFKRLCSSPQYDAKINSSPLGRQLVQLVRARSGKGGSPNFTSLKVKNPGGAFWILNNGKPGLLNLSWTKMFLKHVLDAAGTPLFVPLSEVLASWSVGGAAVFGRYNLGAKL
jgi:hypothetical protein